MKTIGKHVDCNCHVCGVKIFKTDFYLTVYKDNKLYYFCSDHMKEADKFEKENRNESSEH